MEIPHACWLPDRDYHVIDGGADDDLVFITGNSRLLRVSGDLGRRLRLGLDHLTEAEWAEWTQLVDAGVISAENGARTSSSTFADGANLAINVNLTSLCNLGCTYCFAEGGDYGRITGKLDSATVADILAFARAHVTPSGVVRFEFFGGEPLLNFPRIQELCAAAEAVERETGIRFRHRISTNLTVLPRGALELFAKHRFVVSVSIDGAQVTHDRNRPTKGGKSTWAGIVDNCRLVRSASDAIILVARMTALGGYPPLRDDVRALWELNLFDYFQIYPGVVPAALNRIFDHDARTTSAGRKTIQIHPKGSPAAHGQLADAALRPPAAPKTMSGEFLGQLADLLFDYQSLYRKGNRFKGVLEYERIAEMILEGKMALSFCSGGRNYFTFSPDKSVMPCHRLVGDTTFEVGRSHEGLSGTGLEGWRLAVDGHPVCGSCWVRYVCGGGCKQENFQATGDINKPSIEGCDYQMLLVERIAGIIAAAEDDYRKRDRSALDDLFVSCGRPVIANLRAAEAAIPSGVTAFHLV